MTLHSVPHNPNRNSDRYPNKLYGDTNLRIFFGRLTQRLERDTLIQKTTDELRNILQVDRVVLYYFYSQWKGQVTFESLKSRIENQKKIFIRPGVRCS